MQVQYSCCIICVLSFRSIYSAQLGPRNHYLIVSTTERGSVAQGMAFVATVFPMHLDYIQKP